MCLVFATIDRRSPSGHLNVYKSHSEFRSKNPMFVTLEARMHVYDRCILHFEVYLELVDHFDCAIGGILAKWNEVNNLPADKGKLVRFSCDT